MRYIKYLRVSVDMDGEHYIHTMSYLDTLSQLLQSPAIHEPDIETHPNVSPLDGFTLAWWQGSGTVLRMPVNKGEVPMTVRGTIPDIPDSTRELTLCSALIFTFAMRTAVQDVTHVKAVGREGLPHNVVRWAIGTPCLPMVFEYDTDGMV